jgi:hypothetical protein
MIRQIIELLESNDWFGVSENIDIAKGKYKAVSNWSEAKKQIKRTYYGR